MATDRGKPGVFVEYEIVLQDGRLLWEGIADGPIDAMGTWLKANIHNAAILLVEGWLPEARKI